MQADRRSYRVELYTPERHDELLDLERQLWSDDPAIVSDHFDWKFRNNPYGSSIHFYLALHDDRVVGANGMYWSRWEHDERNQTTDLLCRADTVIAPEHRGQGILGDFFRALRLDLTQRGLPFLLGTSAGAPVTHTALNDGWARCGFLESARRAPTRPGFLRRARARVLGMEQKDPWSHTVVPDGTEIGESPRPTDMAALIDELPYDGRIRHLRDEAYFTWRFANPLSTFRFLYVGRDRMEGFMVLQNHVDPTRRPGTAIVDWESTDDRSARSLISAAVECFGHRELVVSINHLDATKRRELGDHGFVGSRPEPDEFRPGIIARGLQSEEPTAWTLGSRRLTDFADWDWRDIYSDNS